MGLSIKKKFQMAGAEGWRFRITPVVQTTWWTEREGSAETFLEEMKLIGPVDVHIEWYKPTPEGNVVEMTGRENV